MDKVRIKKDFLDIDRDKIDEAIHNYAWELKENDELLDTDELIDFYNSLSKEQFQKIIYNLNVFHISDKIFNKIENKEKFFFPFASNIFILGFYDHLFQNHQICELNLNKKEWYNSIRLEYYWSMVIEKSLPTLALKKLFVKKLFEFRKDIRDYIVRSDSNRSTIANYIDESDILDYLQNEATDDDFIFLFSLLGDETKKKVYYSEWFSRKFDLNNYSIKRNLIDELPFDIVVSEWDYEKNSALNYYLLNHKLVYLKLFANGGNKKEIEYHNGHPEMGSLLNISDELLNKLGEDKQRFFSIFDELDDKLILELYLNYYPQKEEKTEMQMFLFNRIQKILENDSDIMIDKISPYVLTSSNELLLGLIAKHLSKDNLLLLSIRSPYFNNLVLQILKDIPDFFNNVYPANNSSMPFPAISQEEKDNYLLNVPSFLKIGNYLNDNQKGIFYVDLFIYTNEEVRNRYMHDVLDNSDLLVSFNHLLFFKDNQTDIIKIVNNMSISKIVNMIYNTIYLKDIIKLLMPIFNTRIDEFVDYLNNPLNTIEIYDNASKIFMFFSSPENIINRINNLDFLGFCSVTYRKFTSLIVDRCATLINNRVDNFDFTWLPSLRDEEEKEFADKLSFEAFVSLACTELRSLAKGSRKYKFYCQYIKDKITDNPDLLYGVLVSSKLEEILYYLPEDYSQSIKEAIDVKYNDLIKKYPEFAEYISNYSDKANYIGAFSNGLINDNTIDIVRQMLKNNKFLFNSMDFRLLKPDFLRMGDYFINKVSRYPIVAFKLNKIYEIDKNKFEIIVKLSNIIRKESIDSIYDQKIEIIINHLFSNDINVNQDLNDDILYNIENYILDQTINRKILFKNIDINDYVNEKQRMIDIKLNNSDDYNEVLDLICQKYFGLSVNTINDFMHEYIENWHSVSELCEDKLPNRYIEQIVKIFNNKSVDSLKEQSMTLERYNISDFLTIKGIMAKTYNMALSKDLSQKSKGVIKKIKVNGKEIEVNDVTDSFGILVHSTDAYGQMPLINNDYYDSWNYNPNTKNHGICCSYITNTSYGTAAVKANGVMFGFDGIGESDFAMFAPYDLGTVNDGFTISSRLRPYYTRLYMIPDYTRHTHNEVSVERRISNSTGGSELRQPSYIIIFEDMEDSVKKNSIKAYKDFKARGIELKIIYIDRVKNCRKQSEILEQMLNEYESSFDLKLLQKIINIYESNLCSCDYLGKGKDLSLNLFDQNELFFTKRIRYCLRKTVKFLKTIDGVDIRNEMIREFIHIISNEQRKFDLIRDINKNRRHVFDLNDSELKEDINYLEQLLNNYVEAKKM